MKRIRDIRLFESNVPNIDENPLPKSIGKMYQYDDLQCIDVIQRLLFLLRYRGFGFEDFDHLYLNFTPCLPHNMVQESRRSKFSEEPWYRYVDVGCDPECFNLWSLPEQTAFILETVKKAVILKAPETLCRTFADTFDEVLQKGADLLIPYRKKADAELTVEIFVRINDEPDFLPVIRVSDKNGTLKTEQHLRAYGREEFISQISTITIGKSYVRIAPRKNWYTDFHDLKPIRVAW